MATIAEFNLGDNIKARRKLLMTYVDVAEDSTTPEWEIVGRGVEDSTLELNPTTNTVTDILDITETEVTKWEPKQSFEPNTVRGGSKLNRLLHKIWEDKTPEKLSQFNVLIVYGYLGTGDTLRGEKHKNCTINITSIGGSEFVDMPIEIMLSNDAVSGDVTISGGKPTFAEDE